MICKRGMFFSADIMCLGSFLIYKRNYYLFNNESLPMKKEKNEKYPGQ